MKTPNLLVFDFYTKMTQTIHDNELLSILLYANNSTGKHYPPY